VHHFVGLHVGVARGQQQHIKIAAGKQPLRLYRVDLRVGKKILYIGKGRAFVGVYRHLDEPDGDAQLFFAAV
jgi:hypothetical protein